MQPVPVDEFVKLHGIYLDWIYNDNILKMIFRKFHEAIYFWISIQFSIGEAYEFETIWIIYI